MLVPTSMFRIQRNAGRLVEARIRSLGSIERVDAYGAGFREIFRESPARPILCADHRPVVIYSQPVADRLGELFASLNQTWERVAILVSHTNATLAMQLQRIVRESANPSRRVFLTADKAEGLSSAQAFLAEIMDTNERARLAAFLDER